MLEVFGLFFICSWIIFYWVFRFVFGFFCGKGVYYFEVFGVSFGEGIRGNNGMFFF